MNMTDDAVIQSLTKTFVGIPFNRMLGLQLESLDEKNVLMSFEMKPELIGNFIQGILHGGVISSVLDMAGGMMVMATAVFKHENAALEDLASIVGRCSTVDLQISYLRPGRGERFMASATLIKRGSKISFTRMDLTNEAGLLIAMGSGTYTIR